MNQDTIIINYGLAAINITTDKTNAGCQACLFVCKEHCFNNSDDVFTRADYNTYVLGNDEYITTAVEKLFPIGTVDGNGAVAKAYINVTPWYLETGWKYCILILKDNGEENAYSVVDSIELTFGTDPLDYEITLATKGDVLDAGDGLEVTVTCPEDIFGTGGIFSVNDFSYEIAIYRYETGLEEGTAFPTDVTCTLAYRQTLDQNTTSFSFVDKNEPEGFNPSQSYRYATVIITYASNDRTINSDGIVCRTASGSTDSCMKFSESYEMGRLWVGDLAENVAYAQNTTSGKSFGETAFRRVLEGGKYFSIVAFKGDKNSFEEWLESDGVGAVDYMHIAYANIPTSLSGYDATLAGSFRLYLEKGNEPLEQFNVSVEKKNDVSLTYDGTEHAVRDFFNVSINYPESGNGVNVTYLVVGQNDDEYVSNPTLKNAGSYKIKIKFEAEGFETVVSDGGNGEGYTVEIAQKELTLGEGYTIPRIDQDSTNLSVPVTGASLVGFANEEDDQYVAFQSCVCTYEDASTAGEAPVIITAILTGPAASNYFINPVQDTGYINKIPVPGITVQQVTNVTYSGNPLQVDQFIAVRGTKEGDEVSYSLDGVTFEPSVSVVNGGVYPVYIKVERDGYNPLVETLNFVVDKATLSARILPNANIPFAYQNEETTFSLGQGYEITGLAEGDTVEVTTAGGTYEDTSTVGTGKKINFLFVLNNGEDIENYIGAIEVSANIGTVVAKKTFSLSANGQPGNDSQSATTTNELTVTFSSAPDRVLTLANIELTRGNNYITLDSITADPENPAKYTIGVTRTGTAGTGIDTVGIRIVNAVDIVSTEQTTDTYLVIAYWGLSPRTAADNQGTEEAPVYALPTIEEILASQDKHGLTGSDTYPIYFTSDLSDPTECTSAYFICLNSCGSVGKPENSAHIIQDEGWNPVSGTEFSGRITECTGFDEDLYIFTIVK